MLSLALKFAAARGTVAALVLLQVMLWSRLLEPDEYATYALIMAAGLLLKALMFNWLGAVVVRFLPDRNLDQGSLLAAATTIFFSLSSGLALLFVASLPWLDRVVSPELVAAVLLVAILGGWLEFSQQLSRARLEHRLLAQKMLGFETLKLCFGLTLVLAGFHEFGLVGATTGAMLATGLLCLRKDRVPLPGKAEGWRAGLRPMLTYGWPIAAAGGLGQCLAVIDRYMLLWMVDEATAGAYALTYELARQPVMLVMLAAATTTMPLAARALNQHGVAAARDVLRSQGTALLLLTLPVVMLEVAFARPLSDLILGASFRETSTAIMPLVALAAFVGGWRSFHLDVSAHLNRSTRTLIGMWLAILLFNVALNTALIPSFGVVGAAWSTLTAHLAGVAYFFLFIPRAPVLDLSWRDVGKIMLALALALPIAMALHADRGGAWFFVSLVIGASVYFGVMLMLRTAGVQLPNVRPRW